MVKKKSGGASTPKYLKIAALAVLSGAVLYFFPFGDIGFGGGWHVCVKYLDEGALYGGQPFCAQGPVIFYYGLLLYQLFGWSLFDYCVHATVVALWLVLAYLVKKVADAEKLKHPFLLAACFILLVVPSSVNNPEVLFSAVFLLAGFYTLFHSTARHRVLAAGFFYALSLYSKYSAIFPIAITSAFYLWRMAHDGRRLTITRAAVESLLKLSMPALALLLCFTAAYPNFLAYTVEAQVSNPGTSYFQSILTLLGSTNMHAIACIIVLLLLAYAMNLKHFRGREVFPLASSSIVLASLSLTHSYGKYMMPSYYAVPAYPFLIISLMALYEKSTKLFAAIFFIGLVFPSIILNPLTEARDSHTTSGIRALRHDVLSGLQYVPPQDGRILLETTKEYKHVLREFNVNVDESKVDYALPGKDFVGHADSFWTPRLTEILGSEAVTNLTEEKLTPEEKEMRADILAGKYSAMVYGPPMFVVIPRILMSIPKHKLSGYCEVYAPNFYYLGRGRSYTQIILRNATHCEDMSMRMAEHYLNTFESVCRRSQKAAEAVILMNQKNGYLIKKKCASGANPEESDIYAIRWFDVVTAALGVLATYTLAEKRKRK